MHASDYFGAYVAWGQVLFFWGTGLVDGDGAGPSTDVEELRTSFLDSILHKCM